MAGCEVDGSAPHNCGPRTAAGAAITSWSALQEHTIPMISHLSRDCARQATVTNNVSGACLQAVQGLTLVWPHTSLSNLSRKENTGKRKPTLACAVESQLVEGKNVAKKDKMSARRCGGIVQPVCKQGLGVDDCWCCWLSYSSPQSVP